VSELRKFADGNGGTGTLRHSLSLLIFDRRRRLAQQPRAVNGCEYQKIKKKKRF